MYCKFSAIPDYIGDKKRNIVFFLKYFYITSILFRSTDYGVCHHYYSRNGYYFAILNIQS